MAPVAAYSAAQAAGSVRCRVAQPSLTRVALLAAVLALLAASAPSAASVAPPHIDGLGDLLRMSTQELASLGGGARDSGDYYTAAVLEMCPHRAAGTNVTQAQATAIMLSNVALIADHAAEAATSGADIMVTPEMGACGFPFTTHASVVPYLLHLPTASAAVPHPQLCTSPQAAAQALHDVAAGATTSTADVLNAMGCTAVANNMTLVIGLPAQVPCAAHPNVTCPRLSGWYFNTQVVISPQGALLSAYHKTHLFEGEKSWFDTPPWGPEIRYFDAPFGVRFGQFICFDLFFRTPEVYEAMELGIQHFTFSTSWVNTALVPLIAAAQLQQAFSRRVGVTMLAANYGNNWQCSGSGIYVNGDARNFTYNAGDSCKNTLMVSRVPKSQPPLPPAPRAALLTPAVPASIVDQPPPTDTPNAGLRGAASAAPLQEYPKNVTTFVAKAGTSGDITVTSGAVTCRVRFNVSDKVTGSDTFGVFAWDGLAFDGLLPLYLCGVALCPPTALDCTAIGVHTHTTFTALEVEGAGTVTTERRLDALPFHTPAYLPAPVYPIAGASESRLLDPVATPLAVTQVAASGADDQRVFTVARLSLAQASPVTNLIIYQHQPQQSPPNRWG